MFVAPTPPSYSVAVRSPLSSFNFERSTFNLFRSKPLACLFAVGCQLLAVSAPVSPFPATLTSSLQLAENTATLSPAFATLADHVKHKSFVCHSYTKHRGVGYLAESNGLSFPLKFRQLAAIPRLRRSGRPLSSTSHQSRITSHLFQNFYPPAPKLRHNPAAQGHTGVRSRNQRTHSIPLTGRIQ